MPLDESKLVGIFFDIFFLPGEGGPEIHGKDAIILVFGVSKDGVDECGEAFDVGFDHVGKVVLDELVQALQSILYEILISDGLGDLRDEVVPVLWVLHDGSDR